MAGVVKSLEQAFNAHDPIALSEQFAKEASWTNAVGRRLDGREAIAGFSGPAMKTFLSDSYARCDVDRLLETAPEAIAVNVHQTPTDNSGTPVDGPHGVTTCVIARQEEGWKIVVGQNSAIYTPPAT